jgi:hypothetical protein
MPLRSSTTNHNSYTYNLIKWINNNHYWEYIVSTGETTFNCRGASKCIKEEYCIYDEFLEHMELPIWEETTIDHPSDHL